MPAKPTFLCVCNLKPSLAKKASRYLHNILGDDVAWEQNCKDGKAIYQPRAMGFPSYTNGFIYIVNGLGVWEKIAFLSLQKKM